MPSQPLGSSMRRNVDLIFRLNVEVHVIFICDIDCTDDKVDCANLSYVIVNTVLGAPAGSDDPT
jgi:hypothetical protein